MTYEEKGIKATDSREVTSDKISETVISEVQIVPMRSNRGLVAIASCVIDDKFFIGSIGLYRRDGQYNITYPNKKFNRSTMTLFHPINIPAGEAIYDAIIKEYENLLASGLEE